MKTIITTLSILFISCGLLAQENGKYEMAMTKVLAQLDNMNDFEQYQTITNQLERIAQNEPTKWQPTYYMAYVQSLKSFVSKDNIGSAAALDALIIKMDEKIKDPELKEQPLILSEIQTIISMMYGARMMENPMVLGAKYGPLAARRLEDALALNPNNPRSFLLKGQSLFYTPEAFGGDKKEAKKLLEKAIGLFDAEAEIDQENFMPRWGKKQAEYILGQMK